MLYRDFTPEQLEQQYNLVARRRDFNETVVPDWKSRSETLRHSARVLLNEKFGEDPHDLLDLFSSARPGPLIAFLHGGYWQRGTKEMYSFIAEPFIDLGISVAILDYNLCPSVKMGDIPPQVRRALIWLWRNAERLGFDGRQISVMGASAGAHLTAMMLTTDWKQVPGSFGADLISKGILISGIYDLVPIVHTSINDALHMDIDEAIALSPILAEQPKQVPQLVVVGGDETAEFHRQSDEYVSKFGTALRPIERYSEPDVDHFDVLNRLTDPKSVFFRKVVDLITGQRSKATRTPAISPTGEASE